MAKTSKRTCQNPIIPAKNMTYSVGIYTRLSHDSHNEKNQSIDNQIAMAKKFVSEKPELHLYKCYSDLGKTGTNFEREGFEELMQDVRMQRVNCIVVKDLSRFARNYIEMGNYLEKIFPFLGVRFISINENLDTSAADFSQDTLGVNLKNLINELYSKDLAAKVKKAKQAKWEMGSFTGGNASYGYQTVWNGKVKSLVIDAETAEIVRGIYHRFLSGQNYKQIALWLYENKIHRPSEYRRYNSIYQNGAEVIHEWGGATIRLLLSNPVYIGNLVQGCTCGFEYQNKKLHDINQEDWTVKENTHPAIISQDDFFQAVERIEAQAHYSNRKGHSKAVPLEPDIFKGIFFCGECGTRMSRVSYIKEFTSGDRIRLYAYRCTNSRRIDEFSCAKKYITFDTLTDMIKHSLKYEFALTSLKPKRLVEKRKSILDEQLAELTNERNRISRQIENEKRAASEAYIKFRSGEMSQVSFLEYKEKSDELQQKRYDRFADMDKLRRATEKTAEEHNKFLRCLMKFNKKSVLDEKLLKSLIKRIDIYPDNRMEIRFLFTKQGLTAFGGDQYE